MIANSKKQFQNYSKSLFSKFRRGYLKYLILVHWWIIKSGPKINRKVIDYFKQNKLLGMQKKMALHIVIRKAITQR